MKKNHLLLIVCCLTLFACNSNHDVRHADATSGDATIADDFKRLDTALSFAGFWVNESYITSVTKTKSPTKAEIPNVSCFTIPGRTLQQTLVIYGFHEGDGRLVVLKHGASYEIWGFEDSLEDKKFDIVFLPENKIQVGNDKFVRLQHSSVEELRIFEQILFQGKYLKDSDAVEFTADGNIKGLDDFKKYSVVVDYDDRGDRADIIQMGTQRYDEQDFGFKFRNDSLYIYELKCVDSLAKEDCLEKDYDKLKYVLVKSIKP